MAPARRQSNGRSPLVNQQRQITSFFTKSSSPSPSPSPSISKHETKPNPNLTPKLSPNPVTLSPIQTKPKKPILVVGKSSNPNPSPNLSPNPSPTTPSPLQGKPKKPLLVIGQSPSSPSTPASGYVTVAKVSKILYGEEVINERIRVYWPLDETWYEGFVKSFNKVSGKHLVQYDDAEEELLDLAKEKIELVKEPMKRFRRLRRFSIKEEEEKMLDVESGGDDSMDEDWGKHVEREAVEDEDLDLEDEEDDGAESVKNLKKRKLGSSTKLGSVKKIKTVGILKKSANNVTVDVSAGKCVEPTKNNDGEKAFALVNNTLVGDAFERFGSREAEKFRFLGKDRRDAKKRLPGDINYDPKTLYLPPDFLESLTGGQRQWWDFKSKHMDKVIFFKMGKFYELYEMDAHVGVKELDLQYMKGEQPHCGFPEKNFSINVEKLARKGYRVLVVEQTETPDQLELRRKDGSKDKVVKREICAIVTKGTLTEGEMLSANPEASYLMSVTESNQHDQRIFGVCVVDVATSRIIIGQFGDDSECSTLSCLLSQLRPAEIIKPAKLLSPETESVLLRHTRNPLVNELVPLLEFWDAEETTSKVRDIFTRINGQSAHLSSNEAAPHNGSSSENGGKDCLPQVLADLVTVGEDGIYALSALGGALFYLKQAFLDETLLRFAKFESLASGLSDITGNPYMVLDAAALENLEIFENSRNGDSSGTLYAQLNHCVTAFGKRLLKAWLSRPLYHLGLIKERQDAVAGLKGVNNQSSALEFRKELSRLPDMERLLARIFSSSEANGRNASKVILYEDAAKKQLQEFISALRGCEVMTSACFSLSKILENADSKLLNHLLKPGKGLPDVHSILRHFQDAFDWVEANNSGRIIPREGADMEYDSASKVVEEIESSLIQHLKEQRKLIGDPSIKYVTIGKDAYLLEVPESLSGNIPSDYELRSSKKGFFRYWTPVIKNYIGKLSQAESEKESKLKSIMQRLVGRFCEHHNRWRQLVSTISELDVLISIAIASDLYEGPTCRPVLVESKNPDDVPCLNASNLGHPILRSDSLGRGTFVPNDFDVGGSGASFILLTGPNMGGKSTLLRQVCLAVVLAQVGADVPAESFKLSPIDRIFVRMGAKDHIMAAQSTFLTELLETASMLSSATYNSLVALDELGRGTSTSDGQAIAASVLEHLVNKVHCRGMFSTHYHRLAVEYQKNPKVSLCHMGCQVGKGVGGVEEVTFLYKLTLGACPKSYGVNVARLAGLPDSVLQKAVAKSQEFEAKYGQHKQLGDSNDTLEDKMMAFIQNLTSISVETSCHASTEGIFGELQSRARILLEQH